MKITKEDVGRRVINGFGRIQIIRGFFDNREKPVLTDSGFFRSDGVYHPNYSYAFHSLVGFFEYDLSDKVYTFGQATDYIVKNPSSEFLCTSCDELRLVFTEDKLCYEDFKGSHPVKNISILDMSLTYRRIKRSLVYKTVTELLSEGFEFKTHGFVKNDIRIDFELLCDLGKDIDPNETQPFNEKTFKAITKEKE